jgi:hypothetical protein
MLWITAMDLRPRPRSSLPALLAGLALAAGCSSKPLQNDPGDGGQADCTGLPIPAIACLIGPTETVCTLDATGKPSWIILCPGNETGGSTGTAGMSGTGGAGGGPGGGSDGGVGAPCASSESCGAGLVCTTIDGDCKAPPGCGPNVGCPAVCYGVCRAANDDAGGPSCGSVQCKKGQVCCNDSCGICTEPGGGCTKQLCPKDPTPTPCTTDGDCKLEADYCTGCDCRALGIKQSVPACPGPGVACFVDPCLNKTARCVNGGCVAQ